MPLYPYECQACQHAFDEVQRMDDKPLRRCPKCKRLKLRRLFGIPNAVIHDNPRCMGQLAADNTRKLVSKHGKTKAAEIIHETVYGKGGNKLKLPKGANAITAPVAEVEVPWYRTGETPGTGPRSDTPIDVTKLKDPIKYIKTGDKD